MCSFPQRLWAQTYLTLSMVTTKGTQTYLATPGHGHHCGHRDIFNTWAWSPLGYTDIFNTWAWIPLGYTDTFITWAWIPLGYTDTFITWAWIPLGYTDIISNTWP